ncbi:MAG: hypothetical protein SCJ93_04485 [Bacillota bacterium]|nr:hypothetical protein [Bacillota bacterium]
MDQRKIKRFINSKNNGVLGIDKGYMIDGYVIKTINHWKIEDSLKKVYPDYKPGETDVYINGKKSNANCGRGKGIIEALHKTLKETKQNIDKLDKLEDTGVNIDSYLKGEDARVYKNTKTGELIMLQEWYTDAFGLNEKDLYRTEILGGTPIDPVVFYDNVTEQIYCLILPIRPAMSDGEYVILTEVNYVIDNYKEE